MTKHIRRILAGAVVAAVLAAVSVLSGVASPANAATDYWVEKYDDHTDIVVDWFAVPKAADDAEDNLGACVQASTEIGPVWLLDQIVCMNFVEACAEMANNDPRYVGHAIRVSFYEHQNRCSVIGVG